MSPRDVFGVTIVMLGGLLTGAAYGQTKAPAPPAGSSGSGGSTAGSIGTTRSTTTSPTTTSPSNSTTIQRPIFLNGKVAIDDGTPLPEAAAILRVCGASEHTEGYTDSSGNFGIQLFNEQGVTQDASETGYGSSTPGGIGQTTTSNGSGGLSSGNSNSNFRRMANCELKARLAGYRSQSIMLVDHQVLDDPNIGTILMHRNRNGEEGNTISAQSLAAPKDARKAFEKGVQLIKKDKADEAFREFQRAVMLYPAFATAWCELGKIEVARGQRDIARGSFTEAVKADPKYVDPYLQLSLLALDDKNWPDLADYTGKALALDSFDYPQEFLFDAVAHYNMRQFDLAQKSVLRAETLDTRQQFPQIVYLKGLVQIRHKDYTGAAESLRAYLKLAPTADDAPKARTQLGELERFLSQSAAKQQ